MVDAPATSAAPRSSAPLWALILSCVGFCFFPSALAGLIVGILALRRIGRDPRIQGKSMAIAAVIVAPIVLLVATVEVAIAIPSFVNYMRRAKAAEAHANVALLARSVASLYELDQARADSAVIAPRLVGSLPLTPSSAGCDPRPWPADAAAGWQVLGFAPDRPIYYSYQLEVAPDGRSFVARAVGDLDCDGATSRLEITGVTEGGTVRLSPLVEVDALE